MIDKKYQVLFQEVPFWCILCGFAAILAILLRTRTKLSWELAGGTFAERSDRVGELSAMMKVKHIDWYIYDECDLRDMDLSERNLDGAHFIKANAQGAYFIKTQLAEADFCGADLRNAYFVEARLRNARFEGADLRGAIFTRADLRGAHFEGCVTDEQTTWYDAEFGDGEEVEEENEENEEDATERITDGIERIDFMEVYVFEEEEV